METKLEKSIYRSRGLGTINLPLQMQILRLRKKSFRRSSYLPTLPFFPLSSILGEYHVFQEAVGTAFRLKIIFLHFEICALSNIHYLHKNRWKSAYTVVRNNLNKEEIHCRKQVNEVVNEKSFKWGTEYLDSSPGTLLLLCSQIY